MRIRWQLISVTVCLKKMNEKINIEEYAKASAERIGSRVMEEAKSLLLGELHRSYKMINKEEFFEQHRKIKMKYMKGFEYIKSSRDYLDYLEEHLTNVMKAFDMLTLACSGMQWVSDDYMYERIKDDVIRHDVSKFSRHEFVQYRDNFFHIINSDTNNEINIKRDFADAWEHHKKHNRHHHESQASTTEDLVHMVVDWTAMGYKFGDTAEEFYLKSKDSINISDEDERFLFEIFDKVKRYNNRKIM